MLNQKAITIATLSINTPNVDDIANEMNITKLAVLGAYAPLKKEGLAIYKNGCIVLTDAGNAHFNPDASVNEELVALITVLSADLDEVKFKDGSRKAICHEIYTNNPGKPKAELNKMLQQATGLPRRNCYVIQYNYEAVLGLH